LVKSPLYQQYWASKYQLTKDQDQKVFYETTKKGYRLATSIGGHITGEHPDRIVCLPKNSNIITDKGLLEIGDIVENKLAVRILSFNHDLVNCECMV
jgi:hypothetical protein